VLLLRHGESVWNAAGRWQGHGDPPLSEAGWRQAHASIASFGTPPTVIVSSDLRRAHDTAGVVAEAFGLAVTTDPRWREWHIGAWSGHTRDEIAARWPDGYARFRAGDLDFVPPGGESQHVFRARVHEALAELRSRHPDGRVLVVCHRGPIRVFLPDLRPPHAQAIPLP